MPGLLEKMLNNAAENPEQTIRSAGAFAELITKLTPAEQVARSYLIESIKANTQMSEIEKAAMISKVKKIIKEYNNEHDIVQKAISILGPQSEEKINTVDEEWASRFLDSAKHVSDESVQTIWARILANECEAPGSVPKQLIHTLSFLDIGNAKGFAALCDFTVDVIGLDSAYPIIDKNQPEILSRYDLTHDRLAELQSFGLIQYTGIGNFMIQTPKILFSYNDSVLEYWGSSASPPKNQDVPVGQVLYTSTGLSLYKAISREYLGEFFDYFSNYASRTGAHLKKIDVVTSEQL